jgi:hypothetical protein
VRTPKGFGKKYFTLSAILACSIQNKLQAAVSSIHSLFYKDHKKEFKDEEESPPEELLELLAPTLLSNNKPCHCDCFFRHKTQLAIHLFHFIPRCPFYTTYFAFRRSGVHPPFHSLLFILKIKKTNIQG